MTWACTLTTTSRWARQGSASSTWPGATSRSSTKRVRPASWRTGRSTTTGPSGRNSRATPSARARIARFPSTYTRTGDLRRPRASMACSPWPSGTARRCTSPGTPWGSNPSTTRSRIAYSISPRRSRPSFPRRQWSTEIRGDWTEDMAVAQIRDLLPAAVSKRLMSDVPLGTFCSGGLDSSLVTALAAKELDSFHTFSTGMAGAPDLEHARKASEFLGTEHHIREFTEDEVLDALPKVAWHLESHDAALFRSAVPTYFVSELARKYVKVVLTGEGADELYAGYR